MSFVKNLSYLSICISLLFNINCSRSTLTVSEAPSKIKPAAFREFRAAWVATVDNIDWPSQPGLTSEQQKQEIMAIIDTATALNLNALIFQVRPQCDALYDSKIEPWSYYLTGEQGKAPSPFYDPLEFWIEQAHAHGIELHVWFNPYRAHHPKGGEITETSIVSRKPGMVRNLNNGFYWLDPALAEVQNYSFQVVMDVVRRYDVDGVHFDDYFYPYGDGTFEDDQAWEQYRNEGGTLSRADWRRDNVNRFIEKVYREIKRDKTHVKFGISPFGIWRPHFPESIRGYDQYNKLYADARLWLNQGWIDYWTPQLYWPISQAQQSFPVLLGWWVKENKKNRNLWPGIAAYRIKNEKGVDEIINQIMISRGFVQQGPGQVHFSMKAMLQNYHGINQALKKGPYKNQALVPPTPWLDDVPPEEPDVLLSDSNDSIKINWEHNDEQDVFTWVVYMKYGDFWQYKILSTQHKQTALAKFYTSYTKSNNKQQDDRELKEINLPLHGVAVSAVDRLGNESKKTIYDIDTHEE